MGDLNGRSDLPICAQTQDRHSLGDDSARKPKLCRDFTSGVRSQQVVMPFVCDELLQSEGTFIAVEAPQLPVYNFVNDDLVQELPAIVPIIADADRAIVRVPYRFVHQGKAAEGLIR